MAATITNTTIVKSSSSSPMYIHNSLVPLTIFDKAAEDLYVTVLHGFKPPIPCNDILKNALSATLNHFPHFAGRMTVDEHGRHSSILNNAGVPVIETYVPTTLDDILPFDSSKQVNHLFPVAEASDELLQIQLNRYACGGLVLGYNANHRVADGQSFSSFMVAWSRLVRGLDIDPLPYIDRATIFHPRKQPKVEFDHRSEQFFNNNVPDTEAFFGPVKTLVTHFSKAFIQDIKAKVMDENINPNQRPYSTFECLLAHVWKKVTQARGLELDQLSQITLAVNGRGRMEPPVPNHYFGNMVLLAYPRLTVGELLMESHAFVANAIRIAVRKIDSRYIQSFIDFGELLKRNGEELHLILPETEYIHMEVNNWLRFDYHQLDFGGGPCTFIHPIIPIEGVVMFLASSQNRGAVDVVMSLRPEHALMFEQICYSLKGPILTNDSLRAKF